MAVFDHRSLNYYLQYYKWIVALVCLPQPRTINKDRRLGNLVKAVGMIGLWSIGHAEIFG